MRNTSIPDEILDRSVSFQQLVTLLNQGPTVDAVWAAERLCEFETRSLEPLCAALSHPVNRVRMAAARSLGEIGDRRAITPLRDAFLKCFEGSPRRQLFVGQLTAGLVFLVLLPLMLLANPLAIIELPLQVAMAKWTTHKHPNPPERSPNSLAASAYMAALVRLAERHSSPEIASLLPELRAAAVDVVNLDRELRHSSREAAERIHALTTRLLTLPIPVMQQRGTVSDLPVPAHTSISRSGLAPGVT